MTVGEAMKSYEVLRRDCEHHNDVEIPSEAKRVFDHAMGNWIRDGAHGFWLPEDDNDGHTKPNEFVATIGRRIAEVQSVYLCSGTQSPIEDMMVGALLWLDMDWAGFPRVDWLGSPSDHIEQFGASAGLEYLITTQAHLAGYRVDMLMWFMHGKSVGGVAIECDGHAFHEKTKEQAAADKRRDREILSAGFPVMRFTGSEIFRDPISCAAQVGEALRDARDRVCREAGMFAGRP